MEPGYTVRRLKLSLREPFTTARGTVRVIRNVLLQFASEHGEVNGEGTPRLAHGSGLSKCLKALRQWMEGARLPASLSSCNPDEILTSFSGPAAAQAALDVALHDLWARERGVTVTVALAQLYGLRSGHVPLSSLTIGIEKTEKMIAKASEAQAFPILKLKLGTDRDLEIVEAVRSVSDADIRVDINGAWTEDEARAKVGRLFDLGVSLLEQPLRAENLRGYLELFGTLPMPVIADESCRTVEDIERLEGAVDGINIKLSKVGGLCAAARMIRAARERDMLVMVGCFVESSLAITAAGALAPYVDFLDLDGAMFLSNDPFAGARIPGGELIMPPGPGLGVRSVRRRRAPSLFGLGATFPG